VSERIDTEVAIVGGGLGGCSAALHLSRRGVPVTLLDKGAVGAGASGVNFGGVRRNGRHLEELPLAERSLVNYWRKLGATSNSAATKRTPPSWRLTPNKPWPTGSSSKP
jgi:glycine/D-amino acid oxidase-like deaminating enzyme